MNNIIAPAPGVPIDANYSTTVLVFKGRVAAYEDVENLNNATLVIFLTNVNGLKPVVKYINKAYPKVKNINKDSVAIRTYTRAGLKCSTPYIANVLVIKTNIAIGQT